MNQQCRIYLPHQYPSVLLPVLQDISGIRQVHECWRVPEVASQVPLEDVWCVEFINSPLFPYDFAPKDYPKPQGNILSQLLRPMTNDSFFTTIYRRADLPDAVHLQCFLEQRKKYQVKIFKGSYPKASPTLANGMIIIAEPTSLDEVLQRISPRSSPTITLENELWEK